MTRKANIAATFALTTITLAARLLPHIANMTPLGTTAIFSGSRLSRPWNYLLPLTILATTDISLGFHKTMIFVYGSFLLTAFLAEKFFKNKKSIIGAGSLGFINSLLFFIITNFGVWLTTTMYAKTVFGLASCYLMAVPFWRNMLVGDILITVGVYSAINAFDYLSIKIKGVEYAKQ